MAAINEIKEIKQKLRDRHSPTRLTALARLVSVDADLAPLLPEISVCLEDPDEGVRQLAATILPKAGLGAVAPLIKAVDPRQPASVRLAAVSALGRLSDAAQPAVEALIVCLADEDPALRANAVIALSRIGSPAVERLTACLATGDEKVRIGAIEALGWIGPDARAAVGALNAVSSKLPLDALLANYAALVKISGQADAGVPMLLGRLGHPQAQIRRSCIERLAELREMAVAAVGQILPCLQDISGEVRAAAALALVCIDPHGSESVEALTGLLQDPHPPARIHAAIALATIGPPARSALPILHRLRTDPDERIAATAAAAAQRIEEQR